MLTVTKLQSFQHCTAHYLYLMSGSKGLIRTIPSTPNRMWQSLLCIHIPTQILQPLHGPYHSVNTFSPIWFLAPVRGQANFRLSVWTFSSLLLSFSDE